MALSGKLTSVDNRGLRRSPLSRTMPPSSVSTLSPGRIAVGYAVLSILWIAFSDEIVTHFGLPPFVMTIKGTLFVLVTAWLLYFTIRRLAQAVQRTSEELHQSEVYLAEAQKLSHTGSWAFDVANDRYLYVSEECLRIFGLHLQEGLPTKEMVLGRIHPEDSERVLRSFEKSVREKVETRDEFRVVLPEGEVKYVYVIRHPVPNGAGDVVQLFGAVIDITERKRSETELRDSETRFRAFVDHAGDALFVQDLEREIIVDVNRSACECLGHTRQELIGKTPHFFHLESDRARMKSVSERAALGEAVFDVHWHRRKDGTLFPVEVHTSRVSYGGQSFLLKVARDISDRVRAEEQREKLRQLETDLAHLSRVSMLGELAASVSHELKQPIAAVALDAATCLRWLRRDHPDVHKAGEAASRIIDDAGRADEIIDRLRALYKKSPPKRELVDVNHTIRQMVTLLLGEANHHAVSIRTELADGLPEIMADRVQLQQVLMNLMLNGIEAMHDTGGVLIVRSQLVQDGGVEISVSDTGVGLPADGADQIFNAFFTTKAQGSGMGLSISRSIVESHGGRIWATSNDGRGASFHFALPIAAAAVVPAAVS